MKSKSNLRRKIWLYLIIFSLSILIFLWLFQIIFLDKYYKWQKTKELVSTVGTIASNYTDENLEQVLDSISYDKGVCIELVENNKLVYLSNTFNKGCTANPQDTYNYKNDFIKSNDSSARYTIKNQRFNNETLVLALKLNDKTHIFVSASLEPLDATVTILKSQFFYVTLIVIILSLIVSYFISKIISDPIIKMKQKANQMAKGNYEIEFEESEIEEIDELSKTLNYACKELNKTEDIRRELLANVSHDLKTPLTMIKAYAELIRDVTHKDKEKMNKNLDTIIEETDRLNILVNDILELSKINSNTQPLNIEKFDINELIKSIIKRYEIYIEKDNYKIEYKEKENIIVSADKKRIEQVIYNLINNAINYTGEDKQVYINLIEGKKDIKIEIKDTGKGIKKEELNNIWDKYYKIDKTHSRVQVGSGIGLSIVKSILENHNFKYGVESKINNGTTFYFEIPKEKK